MPATWLTRGPGDLLTALDDNAEHRPDHLAVQWRGRSLTYAQLATRTRQVAGAMAADGIAAGHRVAVLARNRVELVEVYFAALVLGAVPVVLNWRLATAELRAIVEDAEARLVVVDPQVPSADGLVDPTRDGPAIVLLASTMGNEMASTRGRDYDTWVGEAVPIAGRSSSDLDDTCVQLYTSGTTGRPKGVLLSHRNMWSLLSGAHEDWRVMPGSVLLCPLPAFHIGGLGWILVSVARGATVVLLEEARPDLILRSISAHGVTHVILVPALMASIVEQQLRDRLDIRALEIIVYGASPIPRSQLREALEVLDADFIQAYGMTESCSSMTQLGPEAHREAAGQPEPAEGEPDLLRSCGRPRRGIELSIRALHDGTELPVGEVGEVWVRSAQVMAGYWRRPEETAAVLMPGGWLRTGDMGYFGPDGHLYLCDRVKDMIISGGENIFPAEVESVLLDHPAVAEVAVIGVPSQRWGERPKAYLVLVPSAATPDLKDIRAFCRARLASFKCPDEIEVVPTLPRNASGKLLKKELRRLVTPSLPTGQSSSVR
ncbi:long-chain-fatty-acid--CoA ligase [Verrucosispora sp. WMMA2121]|uniref:class I adenylate-forming enzyme family protein n=1 Tax=Verrucosispora sp. WMMA2121 TaxID=3015164 RepID=UPI0022B64329|nr:long-chain-fatty-acid--CoA ligase [Verrucosispora sp. WMMA2121]MCZ7422144.1 long-chain-fatty-acid--CoA ligase [Verrucosispora sp. WMMA2121]